MLGMRTARHGRWTRPYDVSFAHGPRHAPYKENRKKRLVSFPTTFALQFSSISATAARLEHRALVEVSISGTPSLQRIWKPN